MKLKKKAKGKKKVKANGASRDWAAEVAALKKSKKQKRFKMGSPGSAQVTRVRLLNQHSKLKASTEGEWLTLGF